MATPPEPKLPSPLVALDDERLERRGVRVLLKRDDLIHPEIPGNKWRKLPRNLAAARDSGSAALLTFGGAHSNHLRATAAAGHHLGLRTYGVVRGEEHYPLNDTLERATRHGMELTYLDRATYRRKMDPDVLSGLADRFGDFHVLPEGGSNALGVLGCSELPGEIGADFDVLCCACGTGGTLAGVAGGLAESQRAIGFPVMAGGDYLRDDIAKLQDEAFGAATENWSLCTAFHFGGFARRTPELDAFIAEFRTLHHLDLDWVYVAKMLWGVFTLVERGEFSRGTTVVALLTG